jgi:hypothetical protein
VKILRSYRWRRRLLFTVVPIAIAVPLIYLGVHLSSPGNPENANGPTVPDYKQPKPARFTKAKQRAVRSVLAAFERTAVAREDPARAWDLAAPSLKEGFSRREWNHGSLPVVPYPALDKGLGQWDFVQYSYRDTVGLEVFLFPKPGSGYSAMTADVELVKDHGRWLVDYWMTKKFHGPPALAKGTSKAKHKPKEQAKAAGKRRHPAKKAQPTAEAASPRSSTHLGAVWLAVPIGIVSLIVIVPIALWIVSWRRNRKARLEYERWHRRTKDAA